MKHVIFVLTLLIGAHAVSQDIIYKRDGTKVEAKILSIGDVAVKFKKHSNLNGPDYIVAINLIAMIEFEAGGHTVFNEKTVEQPNRKINTKESVVKESVESPISYGKNLVGFNYIDLLLGSLSFSYERISKNGLVSVRIPVGVGVGNTSGFDGERVRYKFGFELNFYPKKQGRIRYFLGPSIRFRREEFPPSISVDQFGNPVSIKAEFTTFGAYLNNAVLFQISDNFNVSLIVGQGMKNKRKINDVSDTFSEGHAFFEANVGIRF